MRPTIMLLSHSPKRVISLLTLLTLCGCTPPTEPSPPKAPPKESTLLQSQTQALDKAKQLEQVLQNAASAQQAALDEQTR